MKAVIQTGGKQYLVEVNDVLEIEKLTGEPGSKVVFDQIMMIAADDGKKLELGDPVIKGAKVEAEIMDQFKADKIVVFKMKRRKRYRKTQGHRQQMTKIKIIKIDS